MAEAKPFNIAKHKLWEAYQLVRENGGAAGIDNMTLDDVKADEKRLLYKLWNRMSSGSYFPQAVKRVEIPKKNGGKRPLGIPTVLDRVAQMTARLYLEPLIEPHFHPDSYGYRPNKSAHQAVAKARQRCWEYDWVIDVDIKGFFDAIDHELMLKAVEYHKPPEWVRLYVERWLKAPAQDAHGVVFERTTGTPQGGVISPLLANLFLHYAFDKWMDRYHGRNPFERYADDIVIHCKTFDEAKSLLEEITKRLAGCKLTVHPEKTKIVYCKDGRRKEKYEQTAFDFLGFTFRPRKCKSKAGALFLGFTPAISRKAKQAIKDEIRSWKLHRQTGVDLYELSAICNSKLRGWLQYYGEFRRSAMMETFMVFQRVLIKWARNRFKRFKRNWLKAARYLAREAARNPHLFAHWHQGWFLNGCI